MSRREKKDRYASRGSLISTGSSQDGRHGSMTGSSLASGRSRGHLRSGMGSTRYTGGSSYIRGGESSRNIKSMRTGGRKGGKSSGSGRRSRRTKKADAARIMINGHDFTPKALNYGGPVTTSMANVPMALHSAESGSLDPSSSYHGQFRGGVTTSDSGSESATQLGDSSMADRDFRGAGSSGFGMGGMLERSGLLSNSKDHEHEKRPKRLTQQELEAKITVELRETSTMTLLHIPGTRVRGGEGEDEKLHEYVSQQNTRYAAVLEKHKEKDKFTARSAQTFNLSTRNKEVQVSPPQTAEVGCNVTTWDIYDSYQENFEEDDEDVDDEDDEPEIIVSSTIETKGQPATNPLVAPSGNSASAVDNSGSDSNASRSSHNVAGSSYMGSSHVSAGHTSVMSGGPASIDHMAATSPYERLLHSNAFKTACLAVEQAVVQNEIHRHQMLFRNHNEVGTQLEDLLDLGLTIAAGNPSLDDAANQLLQQLEHNKNDGGYGDTNVTGDGINDHGAGGANSTPTQDSKGNPIPHPVGLGLAPESKNKGVLAHLWTYSCPIAKGRNVSCISYNKQNTDLLAAAYGEYNFGHISDGLILFWSLKNPHYPQKIIRCKHSVTSIDFCGEHKHLLAAGMYDGSVAIYDIRDQGDKPAMASLHSTGKHSEPVWGVKWVTNEGGKSGQTLTSISTDGTVFQWSMKKGLVPQELLQLKRVHNKAKLSSSHLEGVSREASGLCFDFPYGDGTQYFCGTEDGVIHKCSTSYNEPLENYFSHTGPVYKVRCNPFLRDCFLSCSADWTCMLWSSKMVKPIMTMQSGCDYVMDLCWSENNSCVFGSVSRDGRVEVWDLDVYALDPLITHQTNKTLTCVSFSPDLPVIQTGARDGSIDVYRIVGVDLDTDIDINFQETKLIEVLATQNQDHKNLQAEAELNSPNPDMPTIIE